MNVTKLMIFKGVTANLSLDSDTECIIHPIYIFECHIGLNCPKSSGMAAAIGANRILSSDSDSACIIYPEYMYNNCIGLFCQ